MTRRCCGIAQEGMRYEGSSTFRGFLMNFNEHQQQRGRDEDEERTSHCPLLRLMTLCALLAHPDQLLHSCRSTKFSNPSFVCGSYSVTTALVGAPENKSRENDNRTEYSWNRRFLLVHPIYSHMFHSGFFHLHNLPKPTLCDTHTSLVKLGFQS